jgi:hypothetical protein
MKIEVLKYDGMYIAETGTDTGLIVVTGHGAIVGDFFFNYTRSERPTDRLKGDTCRRRIFSASTDSFEVTSSITGQTAGDIIMLYKFQEITVLDTTIQVNIAAQQESSYANFMAEGVIIPPGTVVITDGSIDQTYNFTIATAVLAAKTAQGDTKSLHCSEGESSNIYTFYGLDGTTSLDSINTYDIVGDSWAAGTSATSGKNSAQACILDSKIYESGGAGSKTTNMYNPGADSWTALMDAPDIRSDGDGVGLLSVSVFFNSQGGDSGGGAISTDTYYVPAVDTWYQFASDVILSYYGPRFHWHNSYKAYLVGGINFFGIYLPSNISVNFPAKSYFSKTSIPEENAAISAASLENYGVICNGYDGVDTNDIFYVWSETRDVWANITTHPSPSPFGRGSVA